jgi:hypothetical protein
MASSPDSLSAVRPLRVLTLNLWNFMGSFHDYRKFARFASCRIVMNHPTDGIWPSDHYGVYATIDTAP